jgi:hypothetical protein
VQRLVNILLGVAAVVVVLAALLVILADPQVVVSALAG